MKLIGVLSIASLLLIISALFLPYTELTQSEFTTETFGYEHPLAIFQFLFLALIFSISSIVRNKITAVISFSLCFGFFIYFIVLSYFISPIDLSANWEFSFGIGFYIAILSGILCWLVHLLNVVRIYRSELRKEKTL